MNISIASSFVLLVSFVALVQGAPDNRGEISLSDAILKFNQKALRDPIGVNQPPITEDEVVAAIILWERPHDSPVSDELLAAFKTIAKSKSLPAKAAFEKLTGFDRGGAHLFDLWSVRIRLERTDGSSYAFVIRQRVIGLRTLAKELARLDEQFPTEEVEQWVGGYRILDRKKELEARIKKNAN